MAKRHGFTMPYPVHVALQHQQERPFAAAHAERRGPAGPVPAPARDPSRRSCADPGADASAPASGSSTRAMTSTACISWCQEPSRCRWSRMAR